MGSTVAAVASTPRLKRVLGLWDLIYYGIILISPIAAVPMFGEAQVLSRGHAVTTLFVHQLMPNSPFWGLSPIHLLVPLTLYGVIAALYGAWTHNIAMHKQAMIGLYIGGMLIAGGFTFTGRSNPQAFQVLPLVVYKVYPDGRPDEIVRGVNIVGTPLVSLAKIVATGNKTEIFNGYCGAESGSVPVSAASPAILISEMEFAKKETSTDKPPILPPPAHDTDARGQAQ